jgi:DNA-binding CsgD family transcriptional regulator
LQFQSDAGASVGLLEQALANAGRENERTLASIELDLAIAIISHSAETAAAGPHAANAVAHAERIDDPGQLATALAVAAFVNFLAGRKGAQAQMAQAVEIEEPDRQVPMIHRPSMLAGMVLMWTDHPADARVIFDQLFDQASTRGQEGSLPLLGFLAAHLAWQTGELERATSYARSSFEASGHTAANTSRADGLSAQAIIDAHRGDIDVARRRAQEAIDLYHSSFFAAMWPISTLGRLELSVNDPDAAHRVLGPATAHVRRSGIVEPSIVLFVADDIEAMVALGKLDDAKLELDRFEQQGQRLDRASALAAAARCRGLLLSAHGNLDEAATAIQCSLEQHDRVALPLERGRTLLVQGQVERRRKHKAAAKQALEQAVATFEAIGATLWLERARSELSRVGLRPPAPLALTATEMLVAELTASGMSTKQVAERAFISARSVEGVLSRVYRKLGVRSRTELANMMAGRQASPPSAG